MENKNNQSTTPTTVYGEKTLLNIMQRFESQFDRYLADSKIFMIDGERDRLNINLLFNFFISQSNSEGKKFTNLEEGYETNGITINEFKENLSDYNKFKGVMFNALKDLAEKIKIQDLNGKCRSYDVMLRVIERIMNAYNRANEPRQLNNQEIPKIKKKIKKEIKTDAATFLNKPTLGSNRLKKKMSKSKY